MREVGGGKNREEEVKARESSKQIGGKVMASEPQVVMTRSMENAVAPRIAVADDEKKWRRNSVEILEKQKGTGERE